ncbi:MAG: hypothetical protein R3200_07500, partial [Xanthomonadales bacterium]|nr:hypothetical protein [Xanthomonadales bacterium]
MDNKLLEILCCPVSKRPVGVLDTKRLDALNAAIEQGKVEYVDGEQVDEQLDEGLLTDDGKVIYAVR